MATFKKTLSGDDRYYIELEVKEVTGSVSIEDNTSDVSYKLTATKKSGSGYYSNSAVNTVKVTIDGQDIVNKKMSYDFTGSTPKTITLASGTLNNIEHNADGTKSLSCKGYFKDGANSLGSGTASGSLTLSPIPRASSISVSGDIILGSPITIQISRASSDFLHELRYSFGNNENIFIASDIAESYQWTPPLNLAQQIPNADREVMTITCYTYKASDSSSIGSKILQQYAYVPNNLTPSISVSNPTISGDAPASWGLFVKGKSTATYTITGTGVQGSTISSYQSSVDGYTYTTANVTTNTLMTAGTNIINAKVIDSRGKQASTTKTINVVDYSNPTISTAQVQRCDVNGNIDNNGDYCYVSFSGSVTSLNSHNSGVSAYLIRYKTHDAQSYVNSVPVAAFVQNYSGTGMLYTDGIYPANRGSGTKLQLPSTNTYDIQFVVEDYFTESTNVQTLDTGFDLLNFNPSGKSMAIGKVSEANENEELLEVALNTEFSGTVTGETINFTSSNALDMLYGYISSILIGLFNSLGSSDALWDNLPKTTETGTNIELNNSIEAPIRIKLNASETTQNTTTGKNIISFENLSNTTNLGVQISYDKSEIKLNGTTNGSGNLIAYYSLGVTIPAGTYTISYRFGSGTATRGSGQDIAFILRDTNDNNLANITLGQIITSSVKSTTFTTSASTTLKYYAYCNNSGIVLNNLVMQVQLESGSTATSYEPYTGTQPSPSPNFPQNVETTTGRNIINVSGKNLFDKDTTNYKKGYYLNASGVETSGTNWGVYYIPVKPNTSYTISGCQTNGGVQFCWFTDNKTFISAIGQKQNRTNITSPSNASYIGLSIVWNTTSSAYDGTTFMLEQNSSATTYEPYKGNSYEVNLGKNLYDASYRTTSNTIYCANGTATESNGVFTLTATGTDLYMWQVAATGTAYNKNTCGKLYEFVDDEYTITTTNQTIKANYITFYDENKSSISFIGFGGVGYTRTIKKGVNNVPINAKYFSLRFGYNQAVVGESYSFSVQLEKGDVASSYSPYFEPIELCKIGTYQDKIFKNTTGSEYYNSSLVENAWYKYNAIGKVVLNGSENWGLRNDISYQGYIITQNLDYIANTRYTESSITNIYCDYFIPKASYTNTPMLRIVNSNAYGETFVVPTSIANTSETWKTWLTNYNVSVYYPLAAATYTQITNSELINQLEDLKNAHSYNKITNIMQENSELPFILEVDVIDLQNLA